MKHQHTYNDKGERMCCNQTEKIYTKAGAEALLYPNEGAPKSAEEKKHVQRDSDGHDHSHEDSASPWTLFLAPTSALILLLLAISFDNNWLKSAWFVETNRLLWYVVTYLIVGFPVLKDAVRSMLKGEVFSEFLLMSIATLGAFYIGEYPEGVAVMLFYAVGEVFQTLAVSRAKNNIKTLLDQRPDEVTILENDTPKTIKAELAKIGDIIQLKPGEKLGLDGELLSARATFNTAALTGESKPDTKTKGEAVLAGMINLNTASQVQVTVAYTDSKLSKILAMVQDATSQKAPTELFIRKFAKVYTPIVVFCAIAITLLPYFAVDNYVFNEWLYRALVFLVISCPCALVISIPLGYFGGIGAASRNGILFKGSNFLDSLANVQHIVMDKTGTMTEGVFQVQEVKFDAGFDEKQILQLVNSIESMSTHPVATAIHEYVGEVDRSIVLEDTEEIPGQGLRAVVDGKELLVGNFKLMDKFKIAHQVDVASIIYTVIAVAYGGKFVGYITIADAIKDTAAEAIKQFHQLNVRSTMLSGDKTSVVEYVAKQLNIEQAYGDLLPEDKVDKVNAIKSKNESVAFVGDGVNDAPVVALSDVGIAMGGLGSDATIETADVVIQDDNPLKIAMAIRIGKKTKQIVWQNITLAFVVKGIVLILGAGGLATMWEAVFADVGVSLIAILNAIRILRSNFDSR
ncbi:heavy metal translocating P-type ATPase [Sphingobacterium chungjuense]|uniref:heavy metal translocating P-type ATPase n=1 Tax=Sphingobacterium chungjuense TaxID=2675553 RepID=UPI00140AD7A9|nr:heavy metal translocating P-type ATPase [Sphingobacterium chungjuense]